MIMKAFRRIFSIIILAQALFLCSALFASAQAPTNQANTVTACTAQTQFCGTKDVYTPGADGGPGPIAYHGPELSITRLLCTPGQAPATGSAAPDANDLGNCINKLYRAGGAFAAIAGVFFIALAGYLYILGGEKGKEKGKEMFLAVIAGLIIIFTSYILLVQINPQSVRFKTIQPPQLSGIPDKYPECNTIRVQGEQCVISGQVYSSNGTGGGGTGSTSGVTCSGNLEAIPAGIPHKTTQQICPDMAAKLLELAKIYEPSKWTVASAVRNSGYSLCHYTNGTHTIPVSGGGTKTVNVTQNGNCVDLVITGGDGQQPSSSPGWGELCTAIKQVKGLGIFNEATNSSSCPPYNKSDSTGANLHISYNGG